MDQGADDEATESGLRIGVRIRVAVGFLAVVGVLLFPLSTEFGSVHDDRGLFDRLCERRNSLLARGRKRTFIRMFDYISMCATVAGAHDNLIGGTEFARHRVEGMRESCSSHRVRQSHALTNDSSLLGRSMPPLYPRAHEALGCFRGETPPCRRRG